MILEIRGAGFVNKGAELMVLSILQEVHLRNIEAKIVMEPNRHYEKRARLGLYQKLWKRYRGVQWGYAGPLIPHVIREQFGLILDTEVDVVLDASGFAYGDQWGLSNTKTLARSIQRWKRHGEKIILLPQAFGPFSNSKMRRHISSAVDMADLVFARDSISYTHLTEITGARKNIQMFPDFTPLLAGIPPVGTQYTEDICIIPNTKMIRETGSGNPDVYKNFLLSCIRYMKTKQQSCFILTHEKKSDVPFAKMLMQEEPYLRIVEEEDPLRIKGIIGSCKGLISSRYHGIISGLSQGVPTLGTSWSHKYEALFHEYGCRENLIDIKEMNTEQITRALDSLMDTSRRNIASNTLMGYADTHKKKAKEMWDIIFASITSAESPEQVR